MNEFLFRGFELAVLAIITSKIVMNDSYIRESFGCVSEYRFGFGYRLGSSYCESQINQIARVSRFSDCQFLGDALGCGPVLGVKNMASFS